MIVVKPADDGSLEALVAGVVDEFLEQQKQGVCPDVEALVGRYPELAPMLREILDALALAGLSGAGNPPLGKADEPVSGTLGDFRIRGELGRGGMGVVYEAEQISLGRRVALKVLPFAAMMDLRRLQRFQNEARAAACLHHPHIVPVYGVGCERGVHYYAMQFIEGQSLAQLIAHLRNPLSGMSRRSARTCLPRWKGLRSSPRRRRQPPSRRPPSRPRSMRRPGPQALLLHGIGTFSGRWPSGASRRRRLWSTPTAWASSTAMSSRPISCSTVKTRCG